MRRNFAYGPVLLHEALTAAELLGDRLQVVNMPWLNRVDREWLAELVEPFDELFVLEDHAPVGGLGDFLRRELARPVTVFGVEGWPACGTPAEALALPSPRRLVARRADRRRASCRGERRMTAAVVAAAGRRIVRRPRLAVRLLRFPALVPFRSVRARLFRSLSWPLALGLHVETEVAVAGGSRMRVQTDDLVGRVLAISGVWEPNVTAAFTRALAPGDVCLDIGAHIGYYTLLAARIVGPRVTSTRSSRPLLVTAAFE